MSKTSNTNTEIMAAEIASDAAPEALTWSRPTIKTLDVATSTEGGATSNAGGDDGWYAS